MTVSSNSNGTQTATIGTEHTLGTVTSAGTYVLVVNTANMAKGDVLELRANMKATSGGSAAQYFMSSFAHAQADPIKMSIPVPSVNSVAFTLKQTAGTGRSFEWNIYAL